MIEVDIKKSKHTFYLNDLNCATCAGKIEQALQQDARLDDVSFNFTTKKLIFYSALDEARATEYIQSTVDSVEDGVVVDLYEDSYHDDCGSDKCSIDSNDSHDYTGERNGHMKSTPKFILLVKQYKKELTGALLLIAVLIYGPINTVSIICYIISY